VSRLAFWRLLPLTTPEICLGSSLLTLFLTRGVKLGFITILTFCNILEIRLNIGTVELSGTDFFRIRGCGDGRPLFRLRWYNLVLHRSTTAICQCNSSLSSYAS